MPIDPRIPSTPGDFAGVSARLAELERRLRNTSNAVGTLASNSVNGGVIAPGAISGGHIAAGAITAGSIEAGTIVASHIAANAITANHIQANAITAGHIGANVITAGHISANSIAATHIQASAITSTHIAAGTIVAEDIAANAITAQHITAGVIDTVHLAANSVTATQIAALSITAGDIQSNSITTAHIQAGAVIADRIAANTITANQIAANTITGNEIFGSTLSAITSDLGNINAGTITGGTVQTSSSGSRVVIDSLGIRGYALDGVTKVFEVATGSGVASFTGVANIDATSVIPGGTITANTLPGDRIVTASIQTLQLAAGSVKANTIDAGAVTAQKISVKFGGQNVLQNARFDYWPAAPDVPPNGGDSPWMWQHYGGISGTQTWSKVALGGPLGTNSWRAVYSSTTTLTGFMNAAQNVIMPDQTYVFSWWWKGNVQPAIDSNTTWDLITEWVENPTTSATVWQRYSRRLRSSVGGGLAGGKDYFYVYAPAGSGDVQIAMPQWEMGELPSAHTPMADEVLPGSVGATQITPNSITADRMMAGTITAASGIIGDAAITNAKIANVDAGKIDTGFLAAARIQAGSITADKITVAFSGGNMLLNSNFNDGIAGRGTFLTQWYGPAEASGGGIYTDPGYPGGKAWYAPMNDAGSSPYIYTPYVTCTFWSKVSASGWMYAGGTTGRNLVFQFADQNLVVTSTLYGSTRTGVSGWAREVVEGFAKPVGAYYVRMYMQVVDAPLNTGVHWSAATIEEGEKCNAWALAAEDISPGAITETKILPGSITTELITASAITGKTFQTSALNPRVAFDATGLFKTNDAGEKAITVGTNMGEGLHLLTKTSNGLHPASDTYAINFKRSDGVTLSQIWGTQGSANSNEAYLWLAARSPTYNTRADIFIGAHGYNPTNGVTDRTEISLAGGLNDAASRSIFAITNAAGGARLVLDGLGRSNYVQQTSVNKTMTSRGQYGYYGNGTASTTVIVTHNLGATPTYVQITQNVSEASTPPIVYQAYDFTLSTFTVRCYSFLVATSAYDQFAWEAGSVT